MTYVRRFEDSYGLVSTHSTRALPTLGDAVSPWDDVAINGTDWAGEISASSAAEAPSVGAVVKVKFGSVFSSKPQVNIMGPLAAWAEDVTVSGFTLTTEIKPKAHNDYVFEYDVKTR